MFFFAVGCKHGDDMPILVNGDTLPEACTKLVAYLAAAFPGQYSTDPVDFVTDVECGNIVGYGPLAVATTAGEPTETDLGVQVGRVLVHGIKLADYTAALPKLTELADKLGDEAILEHLSDQMGDELSDYKPGEARVELAECWVDGCLGLRQMTSAELRASLLGRVAEYADMIVSDGEFEEGTPLATGVEAYFDFYLSEE